MTELVRIGLIGAGRIGRYHARTLAHLIPEAELAVIADANPEAARSVAESVRLDRWTTDVDGVVSDPAIRAVVVASPTDTHAPLIVAAAGAGKDVFCEKPIALDLATTDAALDAAERAGIRLQIGFQRRFDPGYRKAKDLIDSGALGRVEYVRDAMRDPAPPTAEYVARSGGLFRDMAIHNFDCVRWLVGGEVAEVYALGVVAVDPLFAAHGDVDTSVVTLRFASGPIASVDNSRRATFGYDVRTEVHGSEGAVFVGYSRETPILHLSRAGVASDHVHWFLDRFGEAYVEELRAFVRSIVEETRPAVDGRDGRAALAIAAAADASRLANQPVSLDGFRRRGE